MKDAPQYSENDVTSHELVISFINQFITCQYDPENPFMGYLRHKHTFTCFKTNNDKKHCNCRFNYPLPVMPNTMILQPFPTEERDKWKEKYLAIKNFHHKLYKSKQDELIPFENILQTLNMNEEEYINSLRYSI